MKKSRELSDKIKRLLSSTKLTQAQLASKLGVTQPAISDWKNPKAKSRPSAQTLMQMGNIAPYPDNVWFWKQAGLDESQMVSAAESIVKQRMAAPEESSVIAVPPIGESGGKKVWYVDASLVPNPGCVAYIEIPKWHSSDPVLVDSGGVVILDTSDANAPDLQPFWNRVVLVRYRYPRITDTPTRFYMGRLRLHLDQFINRWWARVGPMPNRGAHVLSEEPPPIGPPKTEGEMLAHLMYRDPLVGQLPIGEWAPSAQDSHDEAVLREQAKRELRANLSNAAILGRVITWFQPPEEPESK